VVRAVQKSLHQHQDDRSRAEKLNRSLVAEEASLYDAVNVLRELEGEMQEAAARLEFERAAHLRDQIKELKKRAGLETNEESRPGKEKEAFRKK